ncbi:phosphatase PAP2 family protein [Sphingomicrobium astaxanthinifaciens]|uniref:phosphatase PAP2 family protein n=1 Tax=Sphingomicrobium astaxanthinifaciens TaxID=1227949 RepID=UPI001FCAA8C9|nr:phosphatase PAP2 family protein [Sphingomicrobium astaxanthinifaciens]MCJ7421690.1 phosphatase PAP2 family protein [Sphingomicrobium astaxanthinifaciens]
MFPRWLPLALLCTLPSLAIAWDYFHVRALLLWVVCAGVTVGLFAILQLARGKGLREVPGTLLLALAAGVGMAGYSSMKMWLNQFGLTADSWLADLDALLFFGDPWRYLAWLKGGHLMVVYHWSWALFIAVSLVRARRDHAFIGGWFILWGIFAPLVQWLVPAGGPVFYERLGLGDRFAGIDPATAGMFVDYLWNAYLANDTEIGGGISAMPSMHVASVVWGALLWRSPAAAAYAAIIFLLSIASGWHYALDGIVGGLLAWGAVALARRLRFLKARAEDEAAPVEPAPAPAA